MWNANSTAHARVNSSPFPNGGGIDTTVLLMLNNTTFISNTTGVRGGRFRITDSITGVITT